MSDLEIAVVMRDPTGEVVLRIDTAEDGPGMAYQLVGITIPEHKRRRTVVTSPWVHGHTETNTILDSTSFGLVVRVFGDTWQQIVTRERALTAAVENIDWLLDVEEYGVRTRWTCDAADVVPRFDQLEAMALQRIVTIDVPVQPIPEVVVS